MSIVLRDTTLVRSVARKLPCWAVVIAPRKGNVEGILALVDNLEVGTASVEKVRDCHRWFDTPSKGKGQQYRHIVSKYALWICQTLRVIQPNQALAEAVWRDPAAWPEWVAEAVDLKPLTKTTAPAWFKVGWKMLLAAANCDVTTIQELRPAGESNVQKGNDRNRKGEAFTEAQRATQREQGIRKSLRRAFIARFGN